MRFITCASYYGSGSSVITDFVSEFSEVYSYGDFEFRFIQDPDGISDLEYNLVENFNRHNSGYALKKYKKLVDFQNGNIFLKRYREKLGNSWKKYSYEYINKLTDFTYNGWWNYDTMDKGTLFYIRKRALNKLLKATIWHNQPERTLNTMRNEITYCSHPSEAKFVALTKEYIENLFSSVANEEKYLMVDQLVPPTNLERYIKYFNDIKIVIVDRDPRDIFVLEKYFWKDGIIPTDVETFCKWFIYTREHRKIDDLNNKNVKFIRFEDMIFDYDNTTKELAQWLGLDLKKQINKKKFFNPNKSMKNVRTWEKVAVQQEEIRYIEKILSDYIYDI